GALFRENLSTAASSTTEPHRDLWAVYVVEGGIAHKRQVEIGRRNGLEAEVIAGLSESDQIIVHPSDRIRDQAQVLPR
ncbi:MAG: hypothetical protein IAG10_27260, partial [Planctomycetaceae bacterium]|nr:hypothetical protein [Planctomycetaceae bacterium]